MTITLEQISEMNIPVGAPIEIICKGKKELIYFQGIGEKFGLRGVVIAYTNEKRKIIDKNTLFAQGYFKYISEITSIKKY